LIGAEGARLLREYGARETPQALRRRGGSPARPRKAKRLERKSKAKFNTLLNLRDFLSPPLFGLSFLRIYLIASTSLITLIVRNVSSSSPWTGRPASMFFLIYKRLSSDMISPGMKIGMPGG